MGNKCDLTPIKLKSAVKDYLWGGTRLITEFNKHTPYEKLAESWELSTHPDGESIVVTGKFKGITLSEYIKANGRNILGSKAGDLDSFPILIKLIDAKDDLSIQVHPDNDYAQAVENGLGKTEMWYIIDCEPGAFVYYGVNRFIEKEEFIRRIENNTLLEILNKVPVKKGDVFFITPGTIHAICGGICICEVQQNSNITYRVYDYNRRDKGGNTRELHIDKAADIALLKPSPEYPRLKGNNLAKCEYFTVKKIECDGIENVKTDIKSFYSIIVIDGGGMLKMNGKDFTLKKGDSVFIPAQEGVFKLCGKLDVILTHI